MMLSLSVERAAQVNPEGEATVSNGRRQTWSSFRDRVARLAAGLVSVRIGPGDRVALLALNSDHYLEALYAIWWSGAVAVPMNTRWSPNEHGWSLDDSGSKALLYDQAFGAMVEHELLELRPAVLPLPMGAVVADRGRGAEALISAYAPIEPVVRVATDLAGIFYTGGTTGRPKGVMLTELALWSCAMSVALDLKLENSPRYLHVAPAFHLADGMMTIGITILAGCHILVPAFRPDSLLETIRSERVSATLMVPTMIRMLIDHEGFDQSAVDTLRTIVYGASPMSLQTLQDATAAFRHARLVQGYGQTELSPICTIFRDEDYTRDPEATGPYPVGRAAYCMQVKVSDVQGREKPRGQAGEIWARGPNAMSGYWQLPELTDAQMSDGWVRTGDVGYMDGNGFVYISDRAKDMIISGGENVFSVEVEDALLLHPLVREAAVIGVPDPVYGERVHAVLVAADAAALDLEDVTEHCRQIISPYKVPRSYEVRTEPLPLSAVGKVLKADLRAPHWSGRERAVN